MKEFDFERLKNIEIEFPDSWVENALNSPEEKRKFIIPKRFYYITASAAAFVIIAAAVTLSMMLGIGKDVDLIAPSPDPSQADNISGGVLPDTTNGSFPSEIPPLSSGAGNQNPTSSTEPSDINGKSENNDSKQKNINTQPDDTKPHPSKKSSSDSKSKVDPKPNQVTTTPYSEYETERPEKPTEPEIEILKPIEPSAEGDTDEPDSIELKFYSFQTTAESALITKKVYCRVVNENGKTLGNGDLFSAERIAYQFGRDIKTIAFECYCNFRYGKSYIVIFYNSNGEIIKQETVTISDASLYIID